MTLIYVGAATTAVVIVLVLLAKHQGTQTVERAKRLVG